MTKTAKAVDFIVIGAGSAGLAAARRACAYGARVAIISRGPLGGTCVNVGCVPKKIMYNAATICEMMRDCAGYGISDISYKFTWSVLRKNRDAYIKKLHGIYNGFLEKCGIEYVCGVAKLVSQHTVDVDGLLYTAPHILIATGSAPTIPDTPGAANGITSDGFFELNDLPKKVAIVGSGYIGVELAGIMKHLGSEVDMFIRGTTVLRGFDNMLQEGVIDAYRHAGINLHFEQEIAKIEKDGRKNTLTLQLHSRETYSGYDCLLWATGRHAQIADLGIEKLGIVKKKNNFINVDCFQNTTIPGIYALGDVCGHFMLTPVAIAAGRRLADRIFNEQKEAHLSYANIPTVVFAHPPVGTVGLTEEQARKAFGDSAVHIFISQFVSLYFAVLDTKSPSRIKMVCVGDEERVVGIHIVGQAADEMLQGFAVAIKMGACRRDFNDTVGIHPTSAEEVVILA